MQKEWVEVNWEGDELVAAKTVNAEEMGIDSLRTKAMEERTEFLSAKTVQSCEKEDLEQAEVAAVEKTEESEASSFSFFSFYPIRFHPFPNARTGHAVYMPIRQQMPADSLSEITQLP
jgi:hypothetical protein